MFIPTRMITTSWLLLVVRPTDNALAKLMLLCAFPSNATMLDWVLVLVLVLVVVDDCIIASTKVMPFSAGMVEKEYCWDVCRVVTTLYPHALASQEPTMAWSPSVSGEMGV